MTPDLIYDQMIGMGCARKVIFSWGGNPGVGSLHRLRDAVEKGWPHKVEIEEHSHAAMANAYRGRRRRAALAVLRGYAARAAQRQRPHQVHRPAPSPASAGRGARGAPGCLHRPRAEGRPGRQRAGRRHRRRAEGSRAGGEAQHRHGRGDRRRPAREADYRPTPASCRAGPSAPSPVPGGAHPSYAHGYYPRDNAFYKAWDKIARDRDTFTRLDRRERHAKGAGGTPP
jgi:glutaconate CoA-transferase, subunit A